MEAYEDVEAQYIAEVNLDADVSMLSDQQKADIGKTASECVLKLTGLKDVIQETLWASFGDLASIKPSRNQEAFVFYA